MDPKQSNLVNQKEKISATATDNISKVDIDHIFK